MRDQLRNDRFSGTLLDLREILEWKFKLPIGLHPTANFFLIHQFKAQDGPDNGAPTITITPRATSSGLNRRIQIIHSADGWTRIPSGRVRC